MGPERESVLFVVNDIPDLEGKTEYQHALGLCESFETTVLAGGEVPWAVRRRANGVRTYTESVWSGIPLLFPLWLLFWIVRIPAAATIVSPHSLYVVVTYVGTRLTSSNQIVDFWDDLTLPIASYSNQNDTVSRIKEIYHRGIFTVACRCISRVDLLILSIHPGIVEKYDLSSVRIVELTNGYRSEMLDVDERPSNEDRTRFVYLGRANTKRGIDTLIQTIVETDALLNLDIVGPTDRAVERVAARLDNVTLHGEQPHEEALGLVARADVGLCILDTTVENYRYSYPIKLFEYAALGKAIIASDTPAIRSVLTDGESVLLVDGCSTEIQEAIITLANEEDFRRTIGENAKAEIREYAWTRILDLYADAIRELLRDSI